MSIQDNKTHIQNSNGRSLSTTTPSSTKFFVTEETLPSISSYLTRNAECIQSSSIPYNQTKQQGPQPYSRHVGLLTNASTTSKTPTLKTPAYRTAPPFNAQHTNVRRLLKNLSTPMPKYYRYKMTASRTTQQKELSNYDYNIMMLYRKLVYYYCPH